MQIRKFGCNLQQFPCEQTILIPKIYNMCGCKQFVTISLCTLHMQTHTSWSTVVSASSAAAVKEVMKKVIDNDKVPCMEDTI